MHKMNRGLRETRGKTMSDVRSRDIDLALVACSKPQKGDPRYKVRYRKDDPATAILPERTSWSSDSVASL